jgi:glycosyltransferase involved in cell wall biosynthesis
MRIVIDATAAVSGGKVYLEQLLPALARIAEGHEFIIFHTSEFDEPALPDSRARFAFRRVALPFGGNWIGAALWKLLWRQTVLPLHLWRLRPDLLFSNAGFAPRWKPAPVRTVLALHNSMPLRAELIAAERSAPRRWRLRWLRRLMRRALQTSDGAIVFSEDTRQRLLAEFGHAGGDVVHHGIDWGAAERARPNGAGPLPRPYLLYVSQFHRYKNVERLIEAFARLAGKHERLRLALVGEAADRGYWREVSAVIAHHGLTDRVRHIPICEREALSGVYRQALAFVHPSLAETCSFPLLEAMAMGLPIAAAKGSALPEMAGDAAVYFDPRDVPDMAAALDRLVYDDALRSALSRGAIERAADFSWARTARQTLDVLERVAGFDRSSKER